MKYVVATALAIFALAEPALAQPIYLDCQMPQEKNSTTMVPWTIALNEEAGTVTWSHPLATNTGRAQFTPDHVIFSDGGLTIDRTTLQLKRQVVFRGEKIGEPDYGQCRISERKRAI